VVPSMLNVSFLVYAMNNVFKTDLIKDVYCKIVIDLESKAST
jgi:hypothetical protein